jgi:hypothetical protein
MKVLVLCNAAALHNAPCWVYNADYWHILHATLTLLQTILCLHPLESTQSFTFILQTGAQQHSPAAFTCKQVFSLAANNMKPTFCPRGNGQSMCTYYTAV